VLNFPQDMVSIFETWFIPSKIRRQMNIFHIMAGSVVAMRKDGQKHPAAFPGFFPNLAIVFRNATETTRCQNPLTW